MKPYYRSKGITIYHADCREILPTLPKVDLVFTSPPYANQRQYGGKLGDWTELMVGIFEDLRLETDGQALVNLGLVHRECEFIEYWRGWLDALPALGWRRFGWYVWDQGFGLPGNWNGRLGPSFEFVFHLNRVARIPNKTKACKCAGQMKGGKGLRMADGTIALKSHHGRPVQAHKVPDSVIRVMRHMARGPECQHPAVFPVSLPSELIEAYSAERQTVLDPLMGSGTTLVAARNLNRKAIGIEIEERYCEIAANRLERAPLQAVRSARQTLSAKAA